MKCLYGAFIYVHNSIYKLYHSLNLKKRQFRHFTLCISHSCKKPFLIFKNNAYFLAGNLVQK
ncbi:hypothetical protein F0640_06550 [Lacticaseibacillus paracasei]|nr:hypothetical protein F0640_06550 [Lacticaseibacillus paracasei]